MPKHASSVCALATCERPRRQREWCVMHYHRWYKHGDPETTKSPGYAPTDVFVRMRDRVEFTDGCWLWSGGDNGRGYGRVYGAGRSHYPHRLAYEFTNGPIPANMVVDHLCRNPRCVNPDHLEVVTSRENTVRGFHARRPAS